MRLVIVQLFLLGLTVGWAGRAETVGEPLSSAYTGRLLVRGELTIDLPSGMSPAETLSGVNVERVRQLIDWQLQYLHGAVRSSSLPKELAHAALVGRGEVHLLGVSIGSRPTTAIVSYEFRDTLVARAAFSATELELKLPRDAASIFPKTIGPETASNRCAEGRSVPEDHLWFFWSPKGACSLGPEDVVAARATIEPTEEPGPKAPAYDAMLGAREGQGGRGAPTKLEVVYLIGDDHTYEDGEDGPGADADEGAGLAAFETAVELLQDAGFSRRGGRPDRRAALLVRKVGGTLVSVDVRLVDPTSFEFVKASAGALETADVFICNGQTGFGNYLDWGRFERVLGRKMELPKKSQIFVFNGASPFTFQTWRLFTAKATTQDPEGFDGLDVVTTPPTLHRVPGAGVAIDVAVLAGLLSPARPTWQEILAKARALAPASDLMTYVTGGR